MTRCEMLSPRRVDVAVKSSAAGPRTAQQTLTVV
jgi:hypothetical protein